MKIESSNFQNNCNLPDKYTCNGKGVAPELFWSDYPDSTRSFALTMDDPDAPGGTFLHWMMVNIPLSVNQVKEENDNIDGATNINNDFDKHGYGAPCPPNGTHRYIFKIFALNTEKIEGVNKNNFYDKINPYIVAEDSLMGKYGK